MPFCSQCGNQVGNRDAFCGRCGARQPLADPMQPAALGGLEGINPKTASILCYVPMVGWLAGIVVLASERFRRDRAVRFHAFQGLYLFVGWLIANQVIRPAFRFIPGMHLHSVVELVLIGASVFMMVKAAHEETYALPLFGELAERSIADD